MASTDSELPQSRAKSLTPLDWARFALATIVAGSAGFAIHVLYGRGWAQNYVDIAAAAGRLRHVYVEPYPAYVVVIAYLTWLLVLAVKIVLFLLLRDRLPGRSRLAKGFWFALLLMAMSDALIRFPIMNIVIGNPIDVVFVQGLEGWAIDLATGLAIALMVP